MVAFGFFSVDCSMFNMVLIALDRLVYIMKPFFYERVVTSTKVKMAITLKPPLHHGGSARRHRWLRHRFEARALHLQQRVGRGEGLLAPAFPLPAIMSESDVTAALLSRSPR
ncbi:hypothetical protein ACOMHN_059379 [Nucella lapillus]